MSFDLVVRGGTVVTEHEVTEADVGILDGRIAAIGPGLPSGGEELDATGRLVLPGGIDSHCHIEQESSLGGVMTADDWTAASRSAAFGGNTTVIPFAIQGRGTSIAEVAGRYRALAEAKSLLDFNLHLTITDPTDATLERELPELIEAGCTSIKLYMAYERMRVGDDGILSVLEVARRCGALPVIHAENWDLIRWATRRLVAAGRTEPRFHAESHPALAEAEAIHRVIRLAEAVDVPILIFHISTRAGIEEVRRARARGATVHAETCPQYLYLTASDLDKPPAEAARLCCSPPLRDDDAQAALWEAIEDGTIDVVSSDHCPYHADERGKLANGPQPSFTQVPNGLPGIETRLPLLFSGTVSAGRTSLARFAALSAATSARLYGLYPRKGAIEPGADADLAVWEPDRQVRISADRLHDEAGYTPFEGIEVRGWPASVIRRGEVVVRDGSLLAAPGSGRFVAGCVPAAATPEPAAMA